MFSKKIHFMFVVTLLLLTSPCFAEEQERFALYIPSHVLKKDNISGFEIKEHNVSSSSIGYFIYYQIYNPSLIANEFNGTQITHTL